MPLTPADDPSWRVGACFRAVVRHHMPRETVEERLTQAIGRDKAARLADIWFRRKPFFNSAEDYQAYRDGLGTDEELADLVAGRHPSVYRQGPRRLGRV